MYRYKNFPKEINSSEYTKQQNSFLWELKQYSGVLSVYSIGELWLYWVSDLDYMIIHNGDISEEFIQKITEKYSLIDTLQFIWESNITDIDYVSHHFAYTLVYWKDFNISFDINNKNLNLIYAWRVCFFSLLRNFYYYIYNEEIHVKQLLSQINDIRYPIYFLKNLWIEKKEYSQFLSEFQEYRESYFRHQDYKKLAIFLKQATDISWDIISELNTVLPDVTDERKNIIWRFPTFFSQENKAVLWKEETEKHLNTIWKYSRFLYIWNKFNPYAWEWDIAVEMDKIQKLNSNFLYMSLPKISWRILLCFKKVFDYIYINVFVR